MAEPQSAANKALKKLEDQLTCAICLDSYKKPKLLQCFHVFCEKCLVPLVVQDGQLSVLCPTCRRSTLLPAASVSGLQSAFHIHHLFEIQEAFEKVKEPQNAQCEKCTKVSRAATNYCRDCGQFICATCTEVHANWEDFSSHEVISLASLKEDVTHLVPPKKVMFYCSKHKGKELELYCETCEELICLHCTVRLHQGHQYDLVNDTFEKHKGEIVASLEPVEKQLATVKKGLEQLGERYEEITDQRAAIEADIHKTIQHLHEALDLRRTELIGELNVMTQQKMKTLAAQRDEVETIQVQLKSCLELVTESLRMGSQGEVMNMKKPVVTQIKKLTANFKPATLNASKSADLKFVASEPIDIQQFGKLYLSNVSSESCYISTKGVQTAVVEKNTTIILHTVDANGEALVVPVESVDCELVSETTAKKTKCTVNHVEIGRYEISYQPTSQGRHHLHIKVEGEYIKGSPFPVMIKLPLHKRTTPTKIIDGLKGPWGVAVTKRGEVIVAESGGHCVSIFSPSGDKLRTFFGSEGSRRGNFKSPCGVAVDDDDNILVVDGGNHCIQTFRSDGQFVKMVGTRGNGQLQFFSPVGVAIHPHNKKVYVADRTNDRIQILNPDLTFSSTINNCGVKPWDVAFDNTGNVYIADCGNRCIQVFTAEGKFQRKFANQGKGNGELDWPTSITIDSNNIVYVTEFSNHRVSVFSSDGKCLTSFGSLGDQPGQFNRPCGISSHQNDTLVISDFGNQRICIL